MKALGVILSFIAWIWKRFLTKRDKNEPQRNIDEARQAAVAGDDERLNAIIAAARDKRMLDEKRGPTSGD